MRLTYSVINVGDGVKGFRPGEMQRIKRASDLLFSMSHQDVSDCVDKTNFWVWNTDSFSMTADGIADRFSL